MRRRALLAALAATAALLTGCAAPSPSSSGKAPAAEALPMSEWKVLDDPRAYEGPSTAVLPDAAVVPVDDAPAQSLPVTAMSHDLDGVHAVTVADTSRVVAMDLSGSLAATVWGLGFGHSLVGRDVSTTFAGTEDLPLVTTGGHTVSSEAVIALRPTLVITDGSIGPRDVVEQLRDVGIPVVFVANEASFAGAQQLARDVAAVYGAPATGEVLAARIGDEVERTRTGIAAITPADEGDRLRMVFLYLRGTAGVYYLFGEESGADEIITALGGVDVAGELGWTGMRPLTDEAMVAADPDLILVMSGGLDSVGGVDGLLAAKPAIAITAAGAHRRFVDMEDGQILSFGPRSAEVLEALARAVYAPAAS